MTECVHCGDPAFLFVGTTGFCRECYRSLDSDSIREHRLRSKGSGGVGSGEPQRTLDVF